MSHHKKISVVIFIFLLFTESSFAKNVLEKTKNKNLKIETNKIEKILTEQSSDKNSQTQKQEKKFDFGFLLSHDRTDFSFDTPAGHSILKWREMSGYSIGTELKYKFFTQNDFNSDSPIKAIDGFFSYTYSKSNGEGTDDDISNGYGAYSVQKARGTSRDIRIGGNFDFENYQNFTPSLRLGGFYKHLTFDMNNGYFLWGGSQNADDGVYLINGLAQRTNSKFSGLTVGGKISHKSNDIENSFIFDFYPAVKYSGNQFWPQRDPQDQRWKLRDANPGIGFKLAFEHYFKIEDQKIKLFSSYESIRVNRLIETGSNYSVNGGSANSAGKGNVKFDSFSMGLGIYF